VTADPETPLQRHAVTYLVRNFDEAIHWFASRLGFFLHCRDFAAAQARMVQAGIRFLEEPRHEAYGTVAVFEDLYGNKRNLVEPAA
jgi:predicted enzyme related to lactoylglutathione lyase